MAGHTNSHLAAFISCELAQEPDVFDLAVLPETVVGDGDGVLCTAIVALALHTLPMWRSTGWHAGSMRGPGG